MIRVNRKRGNPIKMIFDSLSTNSSKENWMCLFLILLLVFPSFVPWLMTYCLCVGSALLTTWTSPDTVNCCYFFTYQVYQHFWKWCLCFIMDKRRREIKSFLCRTLWWCHAALTHIDQKLFGLLPSKARVFLTQEKLNFFSESLTVCCHDSAGEVFFLCSPVSQDTINLPTSSQLHPPRPFKLLKT